MNWPEVSAHAETARLMLIVTSTKDTARIKNEDIKSVEKELCAREGCQIS